MPTIYSIVYQPADKKYGKHDGEFIRVPLQEATLIANHGIQGDAKAGRNPKRQLNLLSREELQALAPTGFNIEPGAFGEQLIIDGLPFSQLKRGDRLILGEEAQITITMPRSTCIRLEAAQGMSNDPLGHLAGFMATVNHGGLIRVGDRVKVNG